MSQKAVEKGFGFLKIPKPLFDSIVEARNFLVKKYVQRDEEATAILTAIISGEPCVLIGEVGTAKTIMSEDSAKLINGKFFFKQLHRYTTIDEVLGAIDIPTYKDKGILRRNVENFFPDSNIALFDDFDKAGSALLNVFLDAILYRRLLNGSEKVTLPTLTILLSANEVPSDDELRAFWDRLTIRKFVRPVPRDQWHNLMKAIHFDGNGETKPMLSVDVVLTLRKEAIERAKWYQNNDKMLDKIEMVYGDLLDERIFISDRKKGKILLVAGAVSTLFAEELPTLDSLADAIRFCSPHDESDLEKVERILSKREMSEFIEPIRKLQAVSDELENWWKDYEKNPTKEQMGKIEAVFNQGSKVLIELTPEQRANPRLRPFVSRLRMTSTKIEDEMLKQKSHFERFGDEAKALLGD
jgi:MoxR-like ATPase